MPLSTKLSKVINISLKIGEIVLACIYLGMVTNAASEKLFDETFFKYGLKVTTFIILTTGFVIPTFLLLLVQLHSSSAENQRKSFFEILYHTCAAIIIGCASGALLSYSEKMISGIKGQSAFRAGGIMGFINTGLYGASAVIAFIEFTRDT